MTTLVIDASVALKWLVPEEMSDVAKELYGFGGRLVAPRLIMTEVANALVRKVIQGLLTHQQATYHFNSLSLLLPELFDVDDLIAPALENACLLRHPIYDLIYLEVARHFNAQFVTADRRFAAKLAGTDFAHQVILLSEWRCA
ncbi:MAG: PilT protein-like [Tardiphaga sp.]|nr:PilT protein-like [Tardiphaga sp.]